MYAAQFVHDGLGYIYLFKVGSCNREFEEANVTLLAKILIDPHCKHGHIQQGSVVL